MTKQSRGSTKKQRGDGVIIYVAVVLVLLLVGAWLLPHIVRKSAPAGMEFTNTTFPVVGAGSSYTYCDQGIFMLKSTDTLMRFYEFESKTTYVMCGETFCSHNGANCPAWGGSFIHHVKGLAAYQGVIYAMFWNEDTGAYDLCSQQLDGTQRTTIASIPLGSYVRPNGSVSESSIYDVVYSGGYAWITKSEVHQIDYEAGSVSGMSYETRRYYGVELATGRLFEIELPVAVSFGNTTNFETATDRILIFSATEKKPLLSEAEFDTAYAAGEYQDLEISELTPTLYDSYYFYWVNNTRATYTYYCYGIDTGELSVLESGFCISDTLDPYMFIGEYDNKLLVEEHCNEYKTIDSDPFYRWDWQNKNFLWDLETGEKTLLFTGPVIMTSNHMMSGHITAEGEIIYMQFLENKEVEIYDYSLETGESRYIYSYDYDDGVTFALEGETPTRFIGTYRDYLCSIDKKDFYNADFSKSVRLSAS